MFRDLCANNLTGEIPSSIGNLKNLEELWLTSLIMNKSVGLTSIFRMLSTNYIAGSIPYSICELFKLKTL